MPIELANECWLPLGGARCPAERLLWPGRGSPSAPQLLAFSPGKEQAAGFPASSVLARAGAGCGSVGDVRKGTPLASRVAQGVSGPPSSCVWNPRVFADDARGWQCPFVLCLPPQGCLRRGNSRDPGSIPESGRSPGGTHGNPLQYSCLENPMDRGVWPATVHGVARVQHD